MRPGERRDYGMSTYRDVLTEAYEAFNARDIERALATMHPEVDWPNGMEGGYVHGHDGVRGYWTRQWRLIDPHGAMVQHVYVIQGGRIRHMEIRK